MVTNRGLLFQNWLRFIYCTSNSSQCLRFKILRALLLSNVGMISNVYLWQTYNSSDPWLNLFICTSDNNNNSKTKTWIKDDVRRGGRKKHERSLQSGYGKSWLNFSYKRSPFFKWPWRYEIVKASLYPANSKFPLNWGQKFTMKA